MIRSIPIPGNSPRLQAFCLCIYLLTALLAPVLRAQTLDTVVFGDSASESAHNLAAPLSQVITGGLGQPARRLLLDSNDTTNGEGGYLNFTVKCDPLKVNYVTLKLWGSDNVTTASGYLLLYQVQDSQLLEVGNRVVALRNIPPIAWVDRAEPTIPNRFYYTTVPLPLSLTQGRTSVDLRVVGAYLDATRGSLPVYRAYVHLGAYFEPAASDPQGGQPLPAPIRPPSAVPLADALAQARAVTTANMNSWLANNNGDLGQLAAGYSVAWTPAYQNPKVATRVLTAVDTLVQGYFATPANASDGSGPDHGWGGAYGDEAVLINQIGAAGFGDALDQVVDLGDPAGPAPRRDLWGKAFAASRNVGQFSRRGPTTNQSIISDKNFYQANKALRTINSPLALPEDHARRFLLESAGLLPWMGSDNADGTPQGWLGSDYYIVTPTGLTKEDGYVSAYGEVYDLVAGYYPATGDERLKNRVVEMLKARSYLRYPMVDDDGYRSFRMVGPLDWRTQQSFPFDQAYGERGARLSVAPATKDPTAIGFAYQAFNDNQGGTFGTDFYAAQTLDTLTTEPDSGARLPNTEGQPDYAWCDVDNGIVAIKRGEELTWIEPYWQSRSGQHSLGRVLQMAPTMARVGVFRSDLQFDWNGNWSAQGDGSGSDVNNPVTTINGVVHQAYLNDKTLQAKAPPTAAAGAQTREEYIGRSAFYATRYGRYLVGINLDKSRSFELKTPVGFSSAPDLITKTTRSGPVMVGPVSCVVLDLGVTIEANPVPTAPKFIQATGTSGGVAVSWETAGGATSYVLKRATSAAGPFNTVASGLGASLPKKWGVWPGGNAFDATAAVGTTYYYQVAGVNAAGAGYDSPVTPGTAATAAVASVNNLPAPWKNVNFANGGSASINSSTGVFSFAGGSGDFYGTSDGGQFTYQRLTGDGTLVARLTAVNSAYKVGLMIRGSLAANALHASIVQQGSNVNGLQRGGAGGTTGYFGTSAATSQPTWLKLEKVGAKVTLSWAPDSSGTAGAWTVLGTSTVAFGNVNYVGPATTSGTPTFDHVTFTPAVNPLPDSPAGIVATPGNGNVTLTWPPASGAVTYTVKRSPTAGGTYTTLASNLSALTYTDAGLTNGTSYYYALSATNPNGTSADSAPVTATPVAIAPTPGNFAVTTTGTRAALSWSASPGAASYTVLRSSDGATWTALATGVTGTTYADTSLANGQSTLYAVVAVNGNGSSPATAAVKTVAAPPAPELLDAGGSNTTARLRWTPATGATGYRLKRATASGGPHGTVATGLLVPAGTDSGLTNRGNYFYVVTAVNDAGESAASPEMKLGWGTGLLGQIYNSNNFSGTPAVTRLEPFIGFDWGQGSPDAAVNVDNFSCRWTGQFEAPKTATYTFTAGNADDTFSMSLNGVTLAKNQSATTNLVAGQRYDLQVTFVDTGGAAYFSLNWTNGSEAPRGLPTSRMYPAAVTAVNRATGGTATANSQNSTEVAANAFDGNTGTKWNTAVNASTGWLQYRFASGVTWAISEYRVTSANDTPARDPRDWRFEGSNNGTTWTTLDTQTGQTFAARYQTNRYPIPNTTAYAYYRLTITATSGGASNTIQLSELGLFFPGSLPAAPDPVTATGRNRRVALGWPAVPGATSYVVKRSSYPGAVFNEVATVAASAGTTYTDTTVANGFNYNYVVSAVSPVGEGENSTPVSVTVVAALDAPAGLAASAGDGVVNLQWNAVPDATAYVVKRAPASNGSYLAIATGVTGTIYQDGTVTNGTTYYYELAATNPTVSSPDTAPVSATPFGPAQLVAPQMTLNGNGTAQVSLANSVPGRTYQLQRSYSLMPGSWVLLGTATAGGGPLTFSDTPDPAQPKVFYRLVIGQ